jgi:hypothetical protein
MVAKSGTAISFETKSPAGFIALLLQPNKKTRIERL